MCGIVAAVNGGTKWSRSPQLTRFMKEYCIVGTLRGFDSTGLMQMGNDFKNPKVLKSTLAGFDFVQQKRVIDTLDDTDTEAFTVLHHRAATQGAVTYDNCHPFQHEGPAGHVIGVHNGTINSWSKKEDGKEFGSDSDWLYHLIANKGPAEALARVKWGAYALFWVNLTAKKFYIASNGDRPIAFAAVKGKDTLLVASEAEMLYAMAARNHMILEQIYRPQEDYYYEFDLSNIRERNKIEINKEKIPSRVIPYTTVVAKKPEAKYIPETRAMQHENKDFITEDWYGNNADDKLAVPRSEEVDFVFKNAVAVPNSPGMYNLFGEVINDAAEVWQAVIDNVPKSTADNARDAIEISTRPIGRREVTNKKTGYVENFILLGYPQSMKLKDVSATDPKYRDWDEESRDVWDTILSEDKSVENDKMVRGPGGSQITSLRFKHFARNGCGSCSDPIGITEAEKLGWIGDSPICEQCCTNLASDTAVLSGV
jgi:predicted glutamine amidotransferase